MRVEWTGRAVTDLMRLHDFLAPVAPVAAARVARDLARAPLRLLEFPRLGERLDAYAPREVRRLIVGRYEMRYEVLPERVVVLRLWYHREDRSLGEDG